MTKKQVCVILSGCGFMDGAEIHEAVLSLLEIERHGGEWHCCAPDVEFAVVNHATGKPTGEKRNVLVESARIARGKIQNIAQVKAAKFAALVMPGGFGAATNLSDFASAGTHARVHPEVDRLIREFLDAGKPVGAKCIAPATLARAAANAHKPMTLTVGNRHDHHDVVAGMEAMSGIKHADTAVTAACLDEPHRVASTPAYMLGPGVADVQQGIEKMVAAVMKWA